MRRAWVRHIAAVCSLWWTTGCSEHPAAPAPYGESAPSAVLVTALSPELVAAGGSGELALVVQMQPGVFMTSDQVTGPRLTRAYLRLKSPERTVTLGSARYPPAASVVIAGIPVLAWDRAFRIAVPYQVSDAARLGTHRLDGTLCYQACTLMGCQPPRTARFTVPLRVSRP